MKIVSAAPLEGSAQPEHESCPACDSDRTSSARQRVEFAWGEGADAVLLSAVHLMWRCAECGSEWTGEDAEIACHNAVCNHLGLLSPEDIIALREGYEMSRPAWAELTKVGSATQGRWERGEIIQNAAYDQYMRLLAIPSNVAFLRSRARHESVGVIPIGSKFRSNAVRGTEDGLRVIGEKFQLRKLG